MKRQALRTLPAICLAGFLAAVLAAPHARAASPLPLAVTVGGIRPGGVIPGVFTACVPAAAAPMAPGPNRNPAVSWANAPAGTRSYTLITFDTDVPTSFAHAYKQGFTLTASDPRRPIWFHWILADIPPSVTSIPEGGDPLGPPGRGKYGLRVNHQAGGGGKAGYSGPCPPWNDMLVHHYHYTVYALNVPSLNLPPDAGGAEVMQAMRGHILAQGEVVGLSTLNPEMEKSLGVR
jgi:Raf kinase inhibitor-like YbhB/YbcL family protein